MQVGSSRKSTRWFLADLAVIPGLAIALAVLGVLTLYGLDMIVPFLSSGQKGVLAPVVVGGFGLGGVFVGIAKGLDDYGRMRDLEDIRSFLGGGVREVLPREVYRSSEESRQYRTTVADTLDSRLRHRNHFHLEQLGPDTRMVVENHVVRARNRRLVEKMSGVSGPRTYALLGEPRGDQSTRHYVGKPPELTGGRDRRKRLPWPRVIVLETREEGVFLWRFDDDGHYAGDTWHSSVEEAKDQARFEYGETLGEWVEVGSQVPRSVGRALAQLG